jgi:multisite-specific tRNA:(cytosine-C5)-methyltransferase
MVLPLWRSLHSLNLMLPKEDRKAMLLRLYNEDVPLASQLKEHHGRLANGNGPDRGAPEAALEASDDEAVTENGTLGTGQAGGREDAAGRAT